MREPILAVKMLQGGGRFEVIGGLHKIGPQAPYFSITANEYSRRGVIESCGCMHDDIEKRFPGQFGELIALHLSDDKGAPMHAYENAWYYAKGGQWIGKRWHPVCDEYGNYDRTARDYPTRESGLPPAGARAKLVRRLLRCDNAAAMELVRIADDYEQALKKQRESRDYRLYAAAHVVCGISTAPFGEAELVEVAAEIEEEGYAQETARLHEQFRAGVDAMRPRWKEEADRAIVRYRLAVYGDRA